MSVIQQSLSRSFPRRAFSVMTPQRAQIPPMNRPGPPPLPAADQREFEDLIKKAAQPVQRAVSETPAAAERHPDAPKTPLPQFEGDVNPVTGEKGGPKREPVRPNSDWSFNGKVTDF